MKNLENLLGSKPTIIRLRKGAPDKINIWTDGSYNELGLDNCNLTDLSESEVYSSIRSGVNYFLPADEGDIKIANKYDNWNDHDQSRILLPHINIGEGYCKVIPYNNFVPKDSFIYKNLSESTSVKYMPYETMTVEEFENLPLTEININYNKYAIKSTTGSGSRGVILIDKDRLNLGGKYVPLLTESQRIEFIDFCKKEDCDVMLQKLIPNKCDLTKINVDFVIKEGVLLGYKWDVTDPKAVFTNWNFGWFHRSKFTDRVMGELTEYLTKNGIYNAIMNFEAFSNMYEDVYLVEFNWRYSNSMFESQALGFDIVGCYLRTEGFEVPYGTHKFTRYWGCKLYSDLVNYVNWK